MSQINKLSDAKLVDRAIMLDNEKKTLDTELTSLKAEIQKRGLLTMMDHNVKYCKMYGDKVGTAIIVLIQAVPAAVYYLYIQMYGTTALNVGLLFDASNWKYWVLPVCSMSLGNVAFYAMWLRRYMVDESNKDYVRLARAKGVSENNIALRHIFRNAMVPLVQYIPSAFLNTVVGSIYIESLYSIPGMGGLLVTCVQRHDNTMVQGIVLLYACVGIIGLILGDLLMVLIDPRISFGKKEGGR